MKKLKIEDDKILVEPQQGRTINGNMFYIIKELSLNEKYKDFKVYVSLKKEALLKAEKVLESNRIKNIELVEILSNKYYKLMASCKYLITDTSFLTFFIKKEGQEILNTWHGTPLKCL